jgi:methionyl-tRNA formyltransferase
MSKRVVFMGTPDFAVPTLKALLDAPDFTVVAVITQPDRPAGRGNRLLPGPVKHIALAAGLEVFQPEKLRGPEVLHKLRRWAPHFQVVAAYGQILRPEVLDIPQHGSINVHASLLPRWRGATPIQAALLAGDTVTGITIMQMDPGLDTGPILSQQSIEITPNDTGETLQTKLAALGGPLLVTTLRGLLAGEIHPRPQDDALATYAPRISKDQGLIDWQRSAVEIDRQVRAFSHWPGTFTYWNDQLLKIAFGYPIAGNPAMLAPGAVSLYDPDAPLVIGTGNGRYAPARLQLAGRTALGVLDFINGFAQIHGAILGNPP